MTKNTESLRDNTTDIIKDKISDYLIETFKSRSSNNRKKEIINLVNNINNSERNKIINYISDLSKNVREYQNFDDQSQLLFLLKEFNLSDEQIRTKLKLDICELGARVLNNTGPLKNNFNDYEIVNKKKSNQTKDWYMNYKDGDKTEIQSEMINIKEGEYKLIVDNNNFKLTYNGGKEVILSRMTYNKALGKFPVIIGRGGVPYSNIEIDMGGGFKLSGFVEFPQIEENKLKIDNLLLGNKRVSSEINKVGENIYLLKVDDFYNYKIKYNPVSNSVQILNGEEYGDNTLLYKGTANPILLKSSNISETKFGRPINEKKYIMGVDFSIEIGRKNLTGTIILPK